MPQPFIILSGPTGVGKTTWLQNTLPEDSQGILSPVIRHARQFFSLHTKEYWPMEAHEKDTEVVLEVGRYRFSKAAFLKASRILENPVTTSWLIVDEVGPLELRGLGLHRALLQLVKQHELPQLWVVRESCVQEVLASYGLNCHPQLQLVQWPELKSLEKLFSTYLYKNSAHGFPLH